MGHICTSLYKIHVQWTVVCNELHPSFQMCLYYNNFLCHFIKILYNNFSSHQLIQTLMVFLSIKDIFRFWFLANHVAPKYLYLCSPLVLLFQYIYCPRKPMKAFTLTKVSMRSGTQEEFFKAKCKQGPSDRWHN